MAQSRRVRGAAAGGKTRRLGSGGCLCAHWAETGGVLPSASPGTEGEEAGRKPHVCKNAGPPEAEGRTGTSWAAGRLEETRAGKSGFLGWR